MPAVRVPRTSRVPQGPIIFVVLVLSALAFWLRFETRSLEAANGTPLPLSPPLRVHPALVSPPATVAAAIDLDAVEIPILDHFRSGENLGQVFANLGLSAVEGHGLSQLLGEIVDLRRLRPSDSYSAYLDRDGALSAFEIMVSGKGEARVERTEGDWRSSWRNFEKTTKVRSLQGILEGTLDASMRTAGGSPVLTYAMADALQWDLDFTRDLRLGDRFNIVFEQVFLDSHDRGPGKILALTYENRGHTFEAYRFGTEGGFYDAEGRPLQKMFLRSPLRFSRITSKFSRRRYHPVLKIHRPHYGVDYGAPVGTPVRATAGGTVASAGWNKGGGRTVKLRHPNDYLTAYLHLSRFAKGMSSGRRVAQGEVIGYVGSSGLATGPHLDYRVKHRGRWIDPLSMKSVPAEPIQQKNLTRFISWRDSLRQGLETGEIGDRLASLLLENDRKGTAVPPTSPVRSTDGARRSIAR